MAVELDRVWQVPVYLPYLQPDLTDRVWAEAEQTLGISLPDSYAELLRVQNGGYIRLKLPETCNSLISGIGPHFPALHSPDWGDCSDWVSFDVEGLIPFDGDGHWHLCFDYRSCRQNPPIALVDLECDSQEIVAKSFADYLTSLRIRDPDDFPEFAVLGESDIQSVVVRLSSTLNKRFEMTGESDHGYCQFRAKVGGSAISPELVWVTPNRVPRGFVRIEDPRHEELEGRLGGWGLRYPEATDACCTITTTDGALGVLTNACEGASIVIRSIDEYFPS